MGQADPVGRVDLVDLEPGLGQGLEVDLEVDLAQDLGPGLEVGRVGQEEEDLRRKSLPKGRNRTAHKISPGIL